MTNVTSGASVKKGGVRRGFGGVGGVVGRGGRVDGRHTDGVVVAEAEAEAVGFV